MAARQIMRTVEKFACGLQGKLPVLRVLNLPHSQVRFGTSLHGREGQFMTSDPPGVCALARDLGRIPKQFRAVRPDSRLALRGPQLKITHRPAARSLVRGVRCLPYAGPAATNIF